MLWTIAAIFSLIWVLGMVTSVTFGGQIHLLLGVAVALLVLHLVKGRRKSGPASRRG